MDLDKHISHTTMIVELTYSLEIKTEQIRSLCSVFRTDNNIYLLEWEN